MEILNAFNIGKIRFRIWIDLDNWFVGFEWSKKWGVFNVHILCLSIQFQKYNT